MSAKLSLARNLASALLAGPWLAEEMLERVSRALGVRGRWAQSIIQRVLERFGEHSAGIDLATLTDFIKADGDFERAWRWYMRGGGRLAHEIFWVVPAMPQSGKRETWKLPALATSTALAEWLGLWPGQLDWFADCQGRQVRAPAGALRHYTFRWLPKASGGARLLEMPKQRLKALQRRVLHEILDAIPPHDAAHAYRRGRSVASYVAPHSGRAIVLRFDLCDFFPSIRAARVHALFREAGYPRGVARALTGLCTNTVPWDVADAYPSAKDKPPYRRARLILSSRHLPQGAPTSPALANLCAYRLDCRLAALAQAVGAQYTRYADDLAFSGGHELARCARRFQVGVCIIALEEGFEVHTRKSRFMRRGVCQQLSGVVVNDHPNVRRMDYERLKAILCNCVRHGPHSQNHERHSDFRSHLRGRIGYVEMLNPVRGRKLRAIFDHIRWESSAPG